MSRLGSLAPALLLALLLAACGGGAQAPESAPGSARAAASVGTPASSSPSAKPAASAAPAAKPAASAKPAAGETKPEKATLEVAISGVGGAFLPLLVAREAGYFTNHGLTVKVNSMPASTANQAVVGGSLDIYNGAASVITAHLAGADLLYVAAPSDRPQIMLFGQKGLKSFTDLRGKTIAMSAAGTSKDIFLHRAASDQHMEVGKDIKFLYNASDQAAIAIFKSNQAEGVALANAADIAAFNAEGYPLLIDYAKEGFKVIEPGVAVSRSFFQKDPNTIKAYLMGWLDGTKRALEDPAYAKPIDAQSIKNTDAKAVDEDYNFGAKLWNKDMTIDPKDIQLALDASTDTKAKTAKPSDFYDNSLIAEVNRDYGSKLFPGDIK